MDFVHYVDLIYGCLRLLQLEFGQPISPILPLVQQALKSATTLLARACVADRNCEHRPDILELIETVDFPSMLRALPDLTTTFCPKLFCLHRGLDELYSCLRSDGGFADPPLDGPHRPIPRYQEFLEIIYSRLLQDPLASCAVSVIYAVFEISYVSLGGIEEFLGLTPGELRRSTAMQGLFGPGSFEFSYSLGMLLKMGRVKLRPSHGYKSAHIDDYMGNAHGCLAFAYTERLNRGDSYARDHWSDHLRYAKPSERLFEMLRRVDIRAYDVKAVIQWLEKNPNIPKDVLARWRAAWVDTIHFYLAPRRPPICILDDMFERYCRLVCVRREPDSLATSFLSLAAPRGSDGLIPPRRMILGTII
ncbi:hypothetical protein BD779DRAFT_1573052 [Infundibulicybe gibba]|nr:hypothetical protein BD779DRAFT_1573052 [Infundibulicybe gibba]